MSRVLVVEDDPDIADLIRHYLQRGGFEVDVRASGRDALSVIALQPPDLLILDLMLPQVSGLDICRTLRSDDKTSSIPIIMVTARAEESERIAGLDLGADDYLAKPFSPGELVARVRALLRRGTGEDTRLRLADLEIDTITRMVKRKGQPIDLKPKEYALLEFLMRQARRPITRTMITEHVWDIHFDSISNVVDVHINSLRNKIDKGFDFPLIRTVRGVGYMLGDKEE